MEILIVTGMSGAGKSRAIDTLEDMGYFCVDNLPPELITVFSSLTERSDMSKVAIVTDIRGGTLFGGLIDTLNKMKTDGKPYKLLFLDADDQILVKRYKETRRKHPLSDMFSGSITQAVHFEREILAPIKEMADFRLDTSLISVSQLKNRITAMFSVGGEGNITIQCMSFGFKYGLPNESDLVFDVRCLPNPYYVEELREKTGLDKEVSDYVMSFDETQGVIKRILELVDYMLPLYMNEGKSQLVISIGCTGGRHRSVAIDEYIGHYLKERHKKVFMNHRDINK